MDLYIVTGHTKGLGQALVQQLGAEQDVELIALGRAPDGPIPGGAQLYVDLAAPRAVEAVCDRIEERLRGKRYDKAVLVNNAGVVSPVGMQDRVHAAELETNLAVNFTAPILLMRRFLIGTATMAKVRRVSAGRPDAEAPEGGGEQGADHDGDHGVAPEARPNGDEADAPEDRPGAEGGPEPTLFHGHARHAGRR